MLAKEINLDAAAVAVLSGNFKIRDEQRTALKDFLSETDVFWANFKTAVHCASCTMGQ